MDAPQPKAPLFKPMTLALAGTGLALTALLPLAFAQPGLRDFNIWNLSVIGALAMFTAARLGFWPGIAFTAAAIALKDLSVYLTSNWWEPYPLSWVYFAGYALLGWAVLRRSEHPGRIACTAIGASLGFFFVSNFVSWLEQALPYGYSLQGLINCYASAVPFFRGTFLGDIAFTGVLFGLHAALSRAFFPAERVRPVRVEAERAEEQTW